MHLGVSVKFYYAVNINMASKLINIIIAVVLIIIVILAIILLSLTLTNAHHNHSEYSPTETTPWNRSLYSIMDYSISSGLITNS